MSGSFSDNQKSPDGFVIPNPITDPTEIDVIKKAFGPDQDGIIPDPQVGACRYTAYLLKYTFRRTIMSDGQVRIECMWKGEVIAFMVVETPQLPILHYPNGKTPQLPTLHYPNNTHNTQLILTVCLHFK